MSTVLVGLPVLHHSQRFHFDKGRRWNAIEHLILGAIADTPRTAGQLAIESNLPRRVVLEVLIRLMKAGWAELRAGTNEITFHATQRGDDVSKEEELPALTERVARYMSFAVDLVTGSIFRRRDLTLLRYEDWAKRTDGYRSVIINRPAELHADTGHVAELLPVLFNENESLVSVDISDRPPMERLALFAVRSGRVEGLPARGGEILEPILLDASKSVPDDIHEGKPTAFTAINPVLKTSRPERSSEFRREDAIIGGEAHKKLLDTVLRKAKDHVVIHSTFLAASRFEAILPALRVAAGRGCRVDILWGQSNQQGGVVTSLREAKQIKLRIEETGLSGTVFVHLASTGSHAKLLIADDGAGRYSATFGSCNWLSSDFGSFEASARLRDPLLVGDALFEAAELARPRDGHLPDLSAKLAQAARIMHTKTSTGGSSKIKILIGEEHDDCVLNARDLAAERITVLSHRLGVTAKPSILIPFTKAVRDRSINVDLFYGRASGPVSQSSVDDSKWILKDKGVELTAIHRPRIHAKMLLWDSDNVIISSLNWLSADATRENPRQEMGVSIVASNLAKFVREKFDISRDFS